MKTAIVLEAVRGCAKADTIYIAQKTPRLVIGAFVYYV